MRALIVEDSRAIRTVLRRFLVAEGVEVEEAEHGAEALLMLGARGAYDFALVDWNMPYLNGLDLVKVVRSHDRFAAMKLVMVTTETEIGQITQAMRAGADEYVMKPFTQEILLEKLALLGLVVKA